MNATWNKVKNQIRSELPKNTFSLWISPIKYLDNKDNAIILGCPNKFSRNWVLDNYHDLIQHKFKNLGATQLDFVFKVDRRKQKALPPFHSHDSKQLALPNVQTITNRSRLTLNKNFTFDRFIVGPSNEFAYSASNEFAHHDLWDYHSLLMLANTGLGKTHLSHAAGHAILQQNPRSRVFYITAEDFINEMVSSLKNNRIEDFKNRYRRSCDVLLLEEIHFLSGKKKTQVELGHTLDSLANDNKKIIFTSSLPPKDIPQMSKDLSSRLTSGLVTKIGKPDFETRVKILQNRTSEYNIIISEEIIHLLASRLKRDIRQLESALKCLKAKSEFLKVKIDSALAKDVLDCLVSSETTISPKDIMDLISKYYKLEPQLLRSKSRKKVYAYPRNIYIYLTRRYTDSTLEKIAETINRTHSTVLYSAELVEHKIKTDTKMRNHVNFLTQKIEDMQR